MKIAYIMHVDWRWIKQRPHFIAEGLAQNNDVTVFYQHRYRVEGGQKNKAQGVALRPLFVIPRGDRIPVLRKVNETIKKWIIQRHVKKENSDCIYLTYPDQVRMIPKAYSGKVIYDCMDDHIAFPSDAEQRQTLKALEKDLVDRADHVLVSSEKLRTVLAERFGCAVEAKITTVRNAFNGEIAASADKQPERTADLFTVAYFGTISSWFDFDLLVKSAEDFPNVKYVLMGPVAGVAIPESPNIEYLGTVEHKDLPDAVSGVDCFIMPFTVNEIIQSVDPVKLYEYINFQKNTLCVEYPEIKRFEPFVYFYSDYASFKRQIEKMLVCNALKYTQQQRLRFLYENDWSSRVTAIEALLQNSENIEEKQHGSS